jgi:hypothetical protein
VAGNNDEWTFKMSKLIEDKNFRIKMGEKAYKKAVNVYTTINAKNEEYYSFLRNACK